VFICVSPFFSRSVPDKDPIPEYLANAVKRDRQHFTRFIFQTEREMISLFEMDFSERDADDSLRGMVHKPDFKIGFPEFLVPAYSV
jgi:hypothetical protein